MALEITPLHANFGGEVRNISLLTLDDVSFAEILHAFYTHGALLCRDQDLAPAQQVSLGKRFGIPSIPPRRQFNLPDHPEVSVLGNLTHPDGSPAAFFNKMGEEWHSDSAGYENLDGATFLYCIASPPVGGETMLCSMTAAWQALPEDRQKDMQDRKVLHSWNYHNDKVMAVSKGKPLTTEQRALYPDHWTDLVQTHPATGQELYYLSHNLVKQIDDWDEVRSQAYTMELADFATRPERIYTHKWHPGDLLVWDNRATMHSATNVERYRDHIRHMHRSYSFMGQWALSGGKLAPIA
ncbi:MAG: TauD/TfdA family dioxygenase [Pseudomonadota bacterium]